MSENYGSARLRLLGVVFLVIIAVFLTLTVAIYRNVFSDDVTVTLRTDRVGNQLQAESDVKVRGIIVGQVRQVRSRGDGAELELAIKPAKIGLIPRDVSARLLPKTLFGARYVNLVVPHGKVAHPLEPGDVITQDRSSGAIELERVLDNMLPLLQAVKPEKLSATLTAMSQALEGRGVPLGQTMVKLNRYLTELNPELPNLKADISAFASASDTYNASAGDFIQAMSDFTVTSKTVLEQRAGLETLYKSLTTTSRDLESFVRQNSRNLIRLSAASRPTLELFAKYSPEYPCLLRAVAEFVPRMDKAFGKDTDEPGLHSTIEVVESRGKYVPGKDDPGPYRENRGPQCYGPDGEWTGPTPPIPSSLPNSPQEREFVASLVAPGIGVQPSEVPAWGTLLVGPLYRGTEVTVR